MMTEVTQKKVAIIGCGKVGACFVPVVQQAGHEVLVLDAVTTVEDALCRGEWPHAHAEPHSKPMKPTRPWRPSRERVDVAVIVVPTPSLPCGEFDDSMVQDALSQCLPDRAALIIVVSTLSPGTELPNGVAYAPVMIQLGDVVRGIRDPGYWLVGADDADTREAAVSFLRTLVSWEPLRPECAFPVLSVQEAILAKISVNLFLAMKVSFANAIGLECRNGRGLDAQAVCHAIGLDPRVGHKYLRPGEPFGGPCLPRDVVAVGTTCPELTGLCDAVTDINREVVEFAIGFQPEDRPIHLVGGMQYREGTDLDIESFGRKLQQACKEHRIKCTEGHYEERPEGAFMIGTRPGAIPPGTPLAFDPFSWK